MENQPTTEASEPDRYRYGIGGATQANGSAVVWQSSTRAHADGPQASYRTRFRSLQDAAGEPGVRRAAPTVGFLQGASGDPRDRYRPGFAWIFSGSLMLPVFLRCFVGDADRPSGFRSVKAPSTKIGSSVGNAQKLPVCDKCGSGIVWVVFTDGMFLISAWWK